MTLVTLLILLLSKIRLKKLLVHVLMREKPILYRADSGVHDNGNFSGIRRYCTSVHSNLFRKSVERKILCGRTMSVISQPSKVQTLTSIAKVSIYFLFSMHQRLL